MVTPPKKGRKPETALQRSNKGVKSHKKTKTYKKIVAHQRSERMKKPPTTKQLRDGEKSEQRRLRNKKQQLVRSQKKGLIAMKEKKEQRQAVAAKLFRLISPAKQPQQQRSSTRLASVPMSSASSPAPRKSQGSPISAEETSNREFLQQKNNLVKMFKTGIMDREQFGELKNRMLDKFGIRRDRSEPENENNNKPTNSAQDALRRQMEEEAKLAPRKHGRGFNMPLHVEQKLNKNAVPITHGTEALFENLEAEDDDCNMFNTEQQEQQQQQQLQLVQDVPPQQEEETEDSWLQPPEDDNDAVMQFLKRSVRDPVLVNILSSLFSEKFCDVEQVRTLVEHINKMPAELAREGVAQIANNNQMTIFEAYQAQQKEQHDAQRCDGCSTFECIRQLDSLNHLPSAECFGKWLQGHLFFYFNTLLAFRLSNGIKDDYDNGDKKPQPVDEEEEEEEEQEEGDDEEEEDTDASDDDSGVGAVAPAKKKKRGRPGQRKADQVAPWGQCCPHCRRDACGMKLANNKCGFTCQQLSNNCDQKVKTKYFYPRTTRPDEKKPPTNNNNNNDGDQLVLNNLVADVPPPPPPPPSTAQNEVYTAEDVFSGKASAEDFMAQPAGVTNNNNEQDDANANSPTLRAGPKIDILSLSNATTKFRPKRSDEQARIDAQRLRDNLNIETWRQFANFFINGWKNFTDRRGNNEDDAAADGDNGDEKHRRRVWMRTGLLDEALLGAMKDFASKVKDVETKKIILSGDSATTKKGGKQRSTPSPKCNITLTRYAPYILEAQVNGRFETSLLGKILAHKFFKCVAYMCASVPLRSIALLLDVPRRVVKEWSNKFLHRVYAHEQRPEKFENVQIDETLIGRKKNNRGFRPRESCFWFLTITEVKRDGSCGRTVWTPVPNRTSATLTAIIKKWIITDSARSLATTDQWPGYSNIPQLLGIHHEIVNHQKGFTNEKGAHTNTAEGVHSVVKRILKELNGGKYGPADGIQPSVAFGTFCVGKPRWQDRFAAALQILKDYAFTTVEPIPPRDVACLPREPPPRLVMNRHNRVLGLTFDFDWERSLKASYEKWTVTCPGQTKTELEAHWDVFVNAEHEHCTIYVGLKYPARLFVHSLGRKKGKNEEGVSAFQSSTYLAHKPEGTRQKPDGTTVNMYSFIEVVYVHKVRHLPDGMTHIPSINHERWGNYIIDKRELEQLRDEDFFEHDDMQQAVDNYSGKKKLVDGDDDDDEGEEYEEGEEGEDFFDDDDEELDNYEDFVEENNNNNNNDNSSDDGDGSDAEEFYLSLDEQLIELDQVDDGVRMSQSYPTRTPRQRKPAALSEQLRTNIDGLPALRALENKVMKFTPSQWGAPVTPRMTNFRDTDDAVHMPLLATRSCKDHWTDMSTFGAYVRSEVLTVMIAIIRGKFWKYMLDSKEPDTAKFFFIPPLLVSESDCSLSNNFQQLPALFKEFKKNKPVLAGVLFDKISDAGHFLCFEYEYNSPKFYIYESLRHPDAPHADVHPCSRDPELIYARYPVTVQKLADSIRRLFGTEIQKFTVEVSHVGVGVQLDGANDCYLQSTNRLIKMISSHALGTDAGFPGRTTRERVRIWMQCVTELNNRNKNELGGRGAMEVALLRYLPKIMFYASDVVN